jgi:hypothetical protein
MLSLTSTFCAIVFATSVFLSSASAQDAGTQPASKTPLDHVLGTITAVDKDAHTVTVQEDKTNAAYTVELANTKTLLKVEPSAKDLKNAVRIAADDLESGDRVDVRGTKQADAPTNLAARSVILMSGRALAEHHQRQAAAWSEATSGVVSTVDPASGTITIEQKSANGPKSISVTTTKSTEFTRFSPETGKAEASQLSAVETGDQLKVLGNKSDDSSSIAAERVYTGAFRTISATISSIAPDGKSIVVKDLASKKDVSVALRPEASIHKLPPMFAAMLARRFNPGGAAAAGSGNGSDGMPPGGAPNRMPAGMPPGGAAGTGPAGAGPGPAGPAGVGPSGMRRGNGDISQMIERMPTVPISDLKPGDAIVIAGVATTSDNSRLAANTVIAGVEPILQAAPQQRGGNRNLGGDWGLGEMSVPQ